MKYFIEWIKIHTWPSQKCSIPLPHSSERFQASSDKFRSAKQVLSAGERPLRQDDQFTRAQLVRTPEESIRRQESILFIIDD